MPKSGGTRGKRQVNSMHAALPTPSASQAVVQITGTPGGNLLQVTNAAGDEPFLCRVPERFRGVVWAKTGGYVIVEMVADANDGEETSKVRATLEHFLYRDQIKHLRLQGLWPFASEEQAPASSDYGALDDALHENTNRPPWARDDDDDDDDDDDGGDDDGSGDDDGGDDDDAAAGNLPPR